MHLAIAISFVLLSSSLGCSNEKEAEPVAKPKASCVVEVQKTAGEADLVKVNGIGSDPAAAESDAWAKAMSAAPAEGEALKDESKWKKSLTPVTGTMNGEVTHNANLSLKRVLPAATGNAVGPDSEKACLAARQKACEAAGAGPDCISSGAYEELSVMGKSN